MSTKTVAPPSADEIADSPKALVDRSIELAFAFIRSDFANPAVLERHLPDHASLALIPDDDPELADYAIQSGIKAVKRGKNMYFLHVTHNADGTLIVKWPETTLPPLNSEAEAE